MDGTPWIAFSQAETIKFSQEEFFNPLFQPLDPVALHFDSPRSNEGNESPPSTKREEESPPNKQEKPSKGGSTNNRFRSSINERKENEKFGKGGPRGFGGKKRNGWQNSRFSRHPEVDNRPSNTRQNHQPQFNGRKDLSHNQLPQQHQSPRINPHRPNWRLNNSRGSPNNRPANGGRHFNNINLGPKNHNNSNNPRKQQQSKARPNSINPNEYTTISTVELRNLRTSQTALQKRISALEQIHMVETKLRQGLSEKCRRLTALEKETAELKKENAALREATIVEEKLDEREDSEHSDGGFSKEELKEKLKVAEKEIEVLNERLDKTETENETVWQQLNALEPQLNTIETEVEHLRKEEAQAKNKLRERNREVKMLENKLKNAGDTMRMMQIKMEEIKKQNSKLTRVIEAQAVQKSPLIDLLVRRKPNLYKQKSSSGRSPSKAGRSSRAPRAHSTQFSKRENSQQLLQQSPTKRKPIATKSKKPMSAERLKRSPRQRPEQQRHARSTTSTQNTESTREPSPPSEEPPRNDSTSDRRPSVQYFGTPDSTSSDSVSSVMDKKEEPKQEKAKEAERSQLAPSRRNAKSKKSESKKIPSVLLYRAGSSRRTKLTPKQKLKRKDINRLRKKSRSSKSNSQDSSNSQLEVLPKQKSSSPKKKSGTEQLPPKQKYSSPKRSKTQKQPPAAPLPEARSKPRNSSHSRGSGQNQRSTGNSRGQNSKRRKSSKSSNKSSGNAMQSPKISNEKQKAAAKHTEEPPKPPPTSPEKSTPVKAFRKPPMSFSQFIKRGQSDDVQEVRL